jgi:prepilin-type N-terminal cleavage/methylation domain-containing protein
MKSAALNRHGMTLLELVAAAAIIGLLATIGCPRATKGVSEAKTAACQTNKANIEVQCEIWRHNNGAWPPTNLSGIGADVNYFPAGVPACPVDGSAYTIDTTGHVLGHNH